MITFFFCADFWLDWLISGPANIDPNPKYIFFTDLNATGPIARPSLG
jgi:hypothetical protein